MSTMVGIWRNVLYRFDIAAPLVGHDNAEQTELPDQS